MSLFKKLERRDYTGGTFSNPLGLPPGAIPTNGMQAFIDGPMPVSVNTAMRHWAVWACVRIIADVVSTLPIDAYSGPAQPIEPLPTKLVTPSAYATKIQWFWQVAASVLLKGNAYGLIASTDRLMYPSQIDLLDPTTVDVMRDSAGHKVFKVAGKTLSAEQVWHLPGPQLPGDLAGMSPISYAARTIGLGLETEQFGADFYRNGIHPTAILESDQQINGDQAAEIKDRVKKAVQGRDLAVLGAGLKLNPWQISASDAAFLDTQRLNALAISQIFGVPPEMIGSASTHSGTLTYANREQRAQDFLNNAVNPLLARLEESLSAWFPRGTYVKFNTGALLRSDLLTRYQAHQIAIRNNIELPSEARALEDLPPIPGLDEKPLPSTGSGGATGGGSTDPSQGGTNNG